MASGLAIYLNDHHAGSTLGVELAKRIAGENADNPALAELARDIESDRASLERIMGRLGVQRTRVKDLAAWSAEKLGRLKLNGQLTGYAPLSRLEELELLSLGVEGKLVLWRALRRTQADRLDPAELAELIARATAQRRRLERLRATAADDALRG